MMKQLRCQLYSGEYQLKSLRLDISNNFTNSDIHRCLTSNYYPSTDRCFNLRRLDIRIKYTCFLKNLIEHVPNLEQLSIQFKFSLKFDILWKTNFEILEQSNENWLNKERRKNIELFV
ncbi:unnamed protein product [Rotaria sp. Silwood2]|nr:unnamed protein product [Rotaria sp. Silwood2]